MHDATNEPTQQTTTRTHKAKQSKAKQSKAKKSKVKQRMNRTECHQIVNQHTDKACGAVEGEPLHGVHVVDGRLSGAGGCQSVLRRVDPGDDSLRGCLLVTSGAVNLA